MLTAIAISASGDEPSLGERAAASQRQHERDKKAVEGRVLNNEDLKHAKGNVIFLPAVPAPSADVQPSVPPAGAAEMVRQLEESRAHAARLRASVEDAERALAASTPGQDREDTERRLRAALDELVEAHEAIGALLQRVRVAGTELHPPSGASDKE